ncbi:MAG: N-acetylmuramoyl-L-alanine amidase [Bradyrhizobium sp. PARBB1]|jgi:N-acetylmuramoyl-L-alanine amidase|uniref:N-acetylmuramoyl-L-alanine amidase family protein n=1 Tax=Bradyrhizobium TaxID=374 RepID=UPI000396D379|nr:MULTISPECIES: N-acetylmuramoyl-L-alanine amidase [Bradyrhizobium]ERF82755.1 MAG: N-acetylmuramoyl-L-alanine amidase [Bradyrhizobium sp. DFCI-1]OYU60387.1 MAG: N-acetylmuramoyl-L-alanine amidase [Bradyrhizobium sp. PARBB1]PSO24035.1 N-acetylmuramoyl-L-alanine amidase [Bradyrhizobium sp. MOS004]HAQ83167.1 N-acetylmuramoyl-L-alanine amidase [Bradyrhizobium sp.]HAR16139.1 N-acetylmuramoyl-L-alanine amidase [Bradyrhizobium sp.]
MRRCESVRVLGGIVAGLRPRRLLVVAIAVLALLPTDISEAGWLPDFFKSSPKHAKPPKRATATRPAKLAKHRAPAKHRVTRLAALGPVALPPSALKPTAGKCDPATFRVVLDVGHTAESEGAMSARNVAEFNFNLRLARQIEETLKAEGFTGTRLLLTEGKARPSLFRRVSAANNLHADLLLSIHHDSVPNKMLEDWEFEGKKSHFSDRFSGYSVFVSRENPDFKTSLRFAELVAGEMKAQGLHYAEQYSQPIMGRDQHPLLNKDTGVYSYDELIVLRKTAMPAVLLEAGSIINREEELKMGSPERRNAIASGVASAVKEFCDPRWVLLGPL